MRADGSSSGIDRSQSAPSAIRGLTQPAARSPALWPAWDIWNSTRSATASPTAGRCWPTRPSGSGASQVTALIGPNGTGKTTLLRIAGGELDPDEGAVGRSGSLAVMPQFIGSVRDDSTVRDLLLSVSPGAGARRLRPLDAAELEMMTDDSEPVALRYAQALADWADVDGYAHETAFDVATVAALGVPYDRAKYRAVTSLSGGEQKRLVLELLLGRAGRGAAARRAGQLPGRAGQAVAGGQAGRHRQGGAAGLARPRVAGQGGKPDRHPGTRRRRRGVLGARRIVRDLSRRPGTTGTPGWRNCAGAGTRSTPNSRRWC